MFVLGWLAVAFAAPSSERGTSADGLNESVEVLRELFGRPSVDCDQPLDADALEGFSSDAIEARRVARRYAKKCEAVEAPLRLPAIDAGFGLVSREGPDLGAVPLDVGVETVRMGRWSSRVGLSVTSQRGYRALTEILPAIEPDGWERRITRTMMTTAADLGVRFAPTKATRVEAVVGMAWHHYRQQWRGIDTHQVPFVGAGAEVLLGSVGVRGRFTTDLRPVDLYLPNGAVERMSPNRFTLTAFYRFGGTKRMPTTNHLLQGTGSRWRASVAELPGLRGSVRAAHREGELTTGSLEIGVEGFRHGNVAFEANLAYRAQHSLRILGIRRAVEAVDVTGDVWFETGEFLAIAASGGVSLRWYTQEWTRIDDLFVPIVGFRTYTPVVRAPGWSAGIDTKTSVDLVSTNLILADTAVVRAAPVAVEVGVRFAFGHQGPLQRGRR